MKTLKCKACLNLILIISFMVILLGIATHGTVAAWSPETNLTNDLAWDRIPSIMQTRDGTIWITWASDRIYMQYDIFYTTSSDYGSTWSDPVRFTRHMTIDDTPYIMQTRNGSIWIVWSSNRTGNLEIYYRTSPDHGSTWSPTIQLTNNAYDDLFPSLTQNTDGTIWAVWQRNVSGNYDIYYKTSSDNGLTWSSTSNLTTDPSWDLRPSITHTYNGTIWIAWASYRTGDYEIFYKTTSDNGSNWSNPTRLTTDGAWDFTPAVLQSVDGTMWVFWASNRNADQNDIYYKTSSDYGVNWSNDIQLPGMSNYDDQNPAITNTNDRKIWVAWHSLRTEDFEIFYTISDEITSVHDIAVTKITPWIPPNKIITSVPKGTTIYVNVTIQNQGTFEESFNVTAYADRITNDLHLSLGTQNITLTNGTTTTLTFIWNTTKTPSGSYFISAEATIVPNEYDINDNILLHGAYIGGIYNSIKLKQPNLFTILSPLTLTILIIATLGLIAIIFFKHLMSIKPQRTWRRFKGRHIKK